MFIFNKIKLGPFLPRVMLYELILINEIEQRAKIIFLSEGTQGEDGILNSGCGWLEVLCVCGGEN